MKAHGQQQLENTIYAVANVMSMCMESFSFIPLTISEEMIFEYFFQIFNLYVAMAINKFSDLDKIHMNRRGLLKKHFCKKQNLNICSETAKIVEFHFSHCKSMAQL